MAKVQLEAILRLVDVQINQQVFRKISQAIAGMPAGLQATAKGLQGANTAAQSLNNTLGTTKSQLTQNEKIARLFLQRMAQFAILLPTFVTLNRAIQGSVKFLFEFDSALRDIVRTDVKGLSGRIEEIGDTALKTATDFGVLAQEVLNITKIFVQAGLTIEDAQKRTQLAIIATQTSTLSAADATEFFIAASQQFGLSSNGLENALDSLIKVEDLAAVEAQDIAEAFRTGGNSFAIFTKDINASIAIITALREQTRKSGAEIGTFFKTFASRAFAAGEARDAIESLGVSVQNLDGTLRPAQDVLNDLTTAFGRLTEAQSANAAKAIAGVRQYETFQALLAANARQNEILAKANDSAGTATKKRLVTDQKLEIQLGKLIAQGQAFAEALGDAGLEDAIKGVLNVATALLKIFTGITNITHDIGGNLAPLLALGGVTLAKGIFGFGKANLPGGGATAAAAGAAGAAGGGGAAVANQLQPAITSINAQLSLFGTAIKNSVLATASYVKGVAANAAGETAALQAAEKAQIEFATAAREASTILKMSRQQNVEAGGGLGGFGKSALGSTFFGLLGTIVIPKILGPLEKEAITTSSTLAKAADSGLSLGATFLASGNIVAAAAAFTAGTLGSLANSAYDAIKANQAAKKQNEETVAKKNSIDAGVQQLKDSTPEADALQKQFLSLLEKNVFNKQTGTELNAAIQKSFTQFSGSKSAQGAGFSDTENFRGSLFKNISVLKQFTINQQDYINEAAKANGRTAEATELFKLLANATDKDMGVAFQKLLVILGATGAAADAASQEIIKAQRSLEELSKIRESERLAEQFRTLTLSLELAQQGPEALADSVVKMKNEILIAERDLRGQRFDQQISDIVSHLSEFGNIGLNPNSDIKSANEFFIKISEGVKLLDPRAIDQYNKFLEALPPAQRKAADEITKILIEQAKAEEALQNQKNDLTKEVSERAKKKFEEEQKASIAAFEATRKFSAELQKFGDSVSSDVLAQFQNVSLKDVEDVFAGKSNLGQGLQQIIQSAFGEDKGASRVAKAQTALRAVTEKTAAEIDTLTKKLDDVNRRLGDQANANDIASLTGEKLGIQLDIEKAKQEGVIDATDAKIKILEAERQAAKEAAEAEKKRLDLLEKLADASRAFANELRDVKRGFEDFAKSKRTDLLGKEADAQKELKDAEQGVLDATKSLADAYSGLIKAQLEFNGAMTEAKIKNNLLSRDIALLTGNISTFDGQLSALSHSFNDVLGHANITLEKRIELERQLAEETLSFLQQARDQIVQAGVGVFGQTATENQDLGKGIAGLQFIVDTLGGSFESFLNLTENELSSVTDTLLNLPAGLRKQILDALSFLPSTTSIGGFSVDQLKQAIGQVGAGVAPEAGLPSIADLNQKQVEQLQRLQDLAVQSAQLQVTQVIAAQKQVDAAIAATEAAKLLQERATQHLTEVRDAVLEESQILDLAAQKNQELLNAVIAADDRNTLNHIEKEAQMFADQNQTFRDVGDTIVKGIAGLITSRLAVISAAADVAAGPKYGGHIPNFAGGNLTPAEAAGILRAAAREKRMMPGGAGLAVANTSEAIIPMRNRGFIPHFADGNFDSIAAGVSAIKQINASVVAAISQSISGALTSLQNNNGSNTEEMLTEVVAQLKSVNDTLNAVNSSNAAIQSNTSATETGGTATPTRESVRIVLETNQNNSVNITGLSALRDEIAAAVKDATSQQVDSQLQSLLTELDSILSALQERGILTSLGQIR